jgi:hypothetical protein
MKTRLFGRGNVLVLAVAAVLASVGVTYATIPSANVISACYLKSGGTLRVVDATTSSCSNKETSLNWNVQGPQGPKGDPGINGTNGTNGIDGTDGTDGADGAPGPAGPAGPAGISTARFVDTSDSDGLALDGGFVKVAADFVPGGSWVVFATVNTIVPQRAGGTDLIPSDATCELRSGGAFIGGATDRRVVPADDTGKRSLSLTGGAQLPGTGQLVSLWCFSQALGESVVSSQMFLLQVGGFS